jgi:MoaA/NifB/PqqE/SkfB family radical SAM enzyme
MDVQRLGLHLTDRCQLDCQHCLRDPDRAPRDLPLATLARVLDQAAALYRIRHVSLTGGEPTLHPEFGAVLDAIAARGCAWDMVTNGRRFAAVDRLLDARPARRAALRALTLSLDGADEATHDAVRGAGSYREVMAAAALCHARGVPFGLQMAVHARNADQIERLGLAASQLGAAHVAFAMTQPTGTAHDAALYLPAHAWRAVRHRIERLAAALRIPVVLPDGYPTDQPFAVCAPFRGETLHVDVRGRLTLCCLHAGTPWDGARADVGGDLGEVSLPAAHRALLGVVHRAQADKLTEIERQALTEWDAFPCNYCLRYFGKPHWTAAGAGGPAARRARWHGAWRPEARAAAPGGRRVRLRVIG